MESTYVLIKPLLTEKTTMLKDKGQQVAFLVHPKANKIEIKTAVEQAFNVTVEAVNVIRRASSVKKRQGRKIGHLPGWKKAYIKLASEDKIELFEGV